MAWYDWLINPIKPAIEYINENWFDSPQPDKADEIQRYNDVLDDLGDAASQFYDDLTGVSAVKLQNELDRQLAEENYRRNLDSIGDTADALEEHGFNRNLMYGSSSASPVRYEAPNLQAYSGSGRIDAVLSRVGKVLGSIPAIYNATAALERIEQERDKTRQADIRTQAMGLDLINKAYAVGDRMLRTPFRYGLTGSKYYSDHLDFFHPLYSWKEDQKENMQKYSDAVLRNQFDLLESIGLSNDLRRTRNSYLGYQFELDRKYGDVGRVIGLAGNAIGGLGNLLKIPAAFMTKKTKIVK